MVAEHDKPIGILVEFPKLEGAAFTLDTPEARKAWRALDKTDIEAVEDFAQAYLGDSLAEIGAAGLWESIHEGDGVAILDTDNARSTPGRGRGQVWHSYSPADWMSEWLGRAISPDQANWLDENYDGPETEDGEMVQEALVQLAEGLPAELSTVSARLEECTAGMATFDLSTVEYWMPQSLLTAAILGGLVREGDHTKFTHAGVVDDRPTGWPIELFEVHRIMEVATSAGDVEVLDQCIGILAAWMKKLARWSVDQPAYIG